MHSFQTLLVPQCARCATAATDAGGQQLLVTDRLLPAELRERLAAEGWTVTPGDPRVNRGVHDPIGEDTLTCPACAERARDQRDLDLHLLTADLARPRIRHLGMADRLGEGWTLTQREGDEGRHRWLVEHDQRVRGQVRRYQRKTGGIYSRGWEAFRLRGTTWDRADAIGACQRNPGSSFLWSARDLAAWGIAANPPYDAERPEWARTTKKESV